MPLEKTSTFFNKFQTHTINMKTMTKLTRYGLLTVVLAGLSGQAQGVPGMINYQGRVTVGGRAVDANAYFKFALVDGGGTTTYWSNDGTSAGEPSRPVTLPVSKGLYFVLLGNTDLGMVAIPTSVFSDHVNVRLRVWFSQASGGPYTLLTPDQRIAAVGYALVAGSFGGTKLALPASDSAEVGVITIGGTQALHTHGIANSFVGGSGNFTMSGTFNTANGSGALFSNTVGTHNTADGTYALIYNAAGNENTANGARSLFSNTEGSANTADGYAALFANTGDNNIALGHFAGLNLTTGDNNIAIGHQGVAGAANTIWIGTEGTHTTTHLAGTVTAQNFVGTAAEPPANVLPVLGMVWIKPGTFIMGSPETDPDSDPDEYPQTVVTLTRGFWMGVHEVTQGEYQAVMNSNPSYFTGDPNRPVERVSWDDAVVYCSKLTTQERDAGRIPSNWQYYLPTEAQWEYACRAGARTARFCYGDDIGYTALGNYAWYYDNSGGTTHPVEQKLGNGWGLMDMHGNVWEWCADWYATYPVGSATDPSGPTTGSYRVIRGGSWLHLAGDCRSAYRYYYGPAYRYAFIGFRVVLVPGQP